MYQLFSLGKVLEKTIILAYDYKSVCKKHKI